MTRRKQHRSRHSSYLVYVVAASQTAPSYTQSERLEKRRPTITHSDQKRLDKNLLVLQVRWSSALYKNRCELVPLRGVVLQTHAPPFAEGETRRLKGTRHDYKRILHGLSSRLDLASSSLIENIQTR